jgi:hypothetical protein
MTFFRMTLTALPLAALTACGGGDFEVRDSPQAVHPSPYPLAQGVVPVAQSTQTCSHHGHACHHKHHKSHGNDGSRPIVD